MKKCEYCGAEIPEERIKALRDDVSYCVKCADDHAPPPKVGFMVFSHKTAPELIQVDPRKKEDLRQARRADDFKSR